MSLWVIIPVKPLGRAKSRLSGVLSPDERSKLAEHMLKHVLEVVRTVPGLGGTLVISRDSKVLSIARDMGAHTVSESGALELNSALMRATEVVRTWRASAVLILPADLPLVSSEDITEMAKLGRFNTSVVIATDDEEDGTNGMLVRPPGLFAYAYGVGSFRRHVEAAEAAGATVSVYRSERLALDIDVPEDLERYNRLSDAGDEPSLTLAAPDIP